MIGMQMGPIDFRRATHSMILEYSRLPSWLPIRICAPHVCSDNDFMGFIFRAGVVGTPPDIRVRQRFHSGTFTEIMYSLLGYGIPVDMFPSTDGVDIKKRNWNQWITKYIARDMELARTGGIFSGVDLPASNDVLWGKGRPTQQHPGNVHLRDLVEEFIDEYQAAQLSADKTKVVHKVCLMIKARSGRFLQKDDDGWWRESRNEDAELKVRKLFQGMKKKKKTPRGQHQTQAPPDDGETDASMFQRQGKRPRSDVGCCGL